MRRNGFTLIELLAVIVILAIIALIATPIILNIIENAREEANIRSIDLYASAVKNGIAAHQLRTGEEVLPNTYTSATLPFEVEYDGDVECNTIEIKEDGTIYVGGCTVNDQTVEYAYGTSNIKIVCRAENIAVKGQYTYGDEYICDPGDGIERTFYLLEDGDTTTLTKTDGSPHEVGDKIGTASKGEVSLIMDSNIANDGTSTTTEFIEWCNWDDYKEAMDAEGTCPSPNYVCYGPNPEDCACEEIPYAGYGPITATQYLKNATHNWNVETYLPTYDQIYSINNSSNFSSTTNAWLFKNMQDYWTSTSTGYTFINSVVFPSDEEGVLLDAFSADSRNGIRPVITISKSQIQ